jgi:hypothetical protein
VAGWVGATAGAVAAGALVLTYAVPGRPHPLPVDVVALSDVSGALSADGSAAVRVRFTQPLDHATTLAALHLTPAAALRTSWQGNTLAVAPVHGFAPNSAYVLTIDGTVARTAAGAPLAGDLHVAFGTAPVAGAGPGGPAAALSRTPVAGAADDAEAVVTLHGSLLLTAARPGPSTGYHSGLVRVSGGTAEKLSTATSAICVSRSGQSVAFLVAGGTGTAVVFASSNGTARTQVPVAVDDGSPLGWIDDAEVSYVGGGRLRSVDQAGHVRTLSNVAVDAAHGIVTISPGGRYVYLARGSGAPGRLVDLRTGAGHELPGITGEPAFSPDGATVVWVDGTTGTPRLRIAAAGGGPVLTAPLPVRRGDTVSDLAIAPGGARLAYSVTSPDGQGQLRLASLPDGTTLAVSTDGAGQSPNWAPSGRRFTVLTFGADGSRIETVAVPAQDTGTRAAAQAATAFTDAQLSADTQAQVALTGPGVRPPRLPRLSRAAVLWTQRATDGTATVRVRLTLDPTTDDPVTRQAEETLTIGPPPSDSGPWTVRAVSVGPFGPAPAGPQLMNLAADATREAATLTFNSDLDPATVRTSVKITTVNGTPLGSTVSYDPANRSVTIRPAQEPTQPLIIRITTGLHDIAGHALATALQVTATLRP